MEEQKAESHAATGEDPVPGEQSEVVITPWKLALVLVALCLCIFCLALDNTILSTAIPRITGQFNSIEDIGWYGSIYQLGSCAVTLVFGKLYARFSPKWVYIIALAVFELGSLVCGLAPNSPSLIIGRTIAGFGAGGLFSGSLIIIARFVPLERRPIFIGLLASSYGVASVIGPVIGGLFTDHVSWRWCFYINLPIGAVAGILVLILIPSWSPSRGPRTLKGTLLDLDPVGNLFFLPSIVLLLVALELGGSRYTWSSWRIILLLVLAGVLMLAFVASQLLNPDCAMIPPRLFRNRSVCGACWFMFCVSGGFLVFVYYLPIWFQAVKGVSAAESSKMFLPFILGTVLLSPITGVLVSLLGYPKPLLLLSPVLMSIGAGLLTTLTPFSSASKWIGFQALLGIGAGMGLELPIVVVQSVSLPDDIAVSSSTISFVQMLAGAVFITVAQSTFENRLLHNALVYAPSVNRRDLLGAGAADLRDHFRGDVLRQVLVAYNAAVTQTFYVGVAVVALAIIGAVIVRWASIKGC